MVVRLLVSFFAVWGTNLNMKERLFIPFAWLPKATVQVEILLNLYVPQGSHRFEKYLNIQECLEKSLKIKFAFIPFAWLPKATVQVQIFLNLYAGLQIRVRN